jgi:hypothetical protein
MNLPVLRPPLLDCRKQRYSSFRRHPAAVEGPRIRLTITDGNPAKSRYSGANGTNLLLTGCLLAVARVEPLQPNGHIP